MKHFILLGLLCFSFFNSFAQRSKTDSLRTVVQHAKEDTNKVVALNLLCRQLYLTGKYDTAMICAQQAKSLSQKIEYSRGVGNSWNNMGNIYMLLGKYPQSLLCHKISLGIQTKINYRMGIASSHNNIGNISFYQGNYPEALMNYLEALKIYKAFDTVPAIRVNLASAYNNVGNVYFVQKNYTNALTYYKNAKTIREEIGDQHGLAATCGNIGLIYYSLNNYGEALKYHFISLNIKKGIDDQNGMAASYGNIGAAYFAQGKYAEALENFSASAAACVANTSGISEVLANAYTNMGQVYIKQKKNSDALRYFNMSLVIGKQLNNKEVMKNIYDGLASADSALGNWASAFNHRKLFVQYRDSLLNEENTQKITEAQMNFNFEQKEIKRKADDDRKEARQKVEQESREERSKLIMWFMIASAVLLSFLALLAFNRYRLKQKNIYQQQLNKQQKEQAVAVMETQEQERKRIAEDLHDSLGHLLSTAKLNLQTFPAGQQHLTENPLELLNQASTEIRNITFNLMPKTLEEEGLIPALNELASKCPVKVMLQVHGMENVSLEKQAQFNIYRIIQEAVNNILKHAQANEINLQLIHRDKQLTIMIEDDGKGFDKNMVKKKGRGLTNITTRAKWLNGAVAFDSSPGRGTTISIEIPV
jgi:two-component system NarL family sensor kinase